MKESFIVRNKAIIRGIFIRAAFLGILLYFLFQ